MKRRRQRRRPWTPESERRYAEAAISSAAPTSRSTLRRFAQWLEQRGLALGSITIRVTSARSFVDWVSREAWSAAAGFRKLTPEGIERFFVGYGKGHGQGARRSMRSAMRLFLRFTTERGWTTADLVDAVPSLRSYRLSTVPRALDDHAVSQLLAALARVNARDRAIVHLLVTYGARRRQVSALKLQDIDWERRRLTFRAHKRGKAVTHVLTPLVAESLATYLRHERPAVASDAVFLRRLPPHLRVSPCCVTEVVRQLMMRAGLPPRGPHALRHSFATRLLAAGQSVKVIADLLGHRSLASVAVYAKVDYVRLLEVAQAWPEVAS
jgi:integrase/recombinase XerD